MARPRKLTKKLENTILELIADGKTIRETFEIIKDYTWQSFRKELLEDDSLMMKYIKSKELAIDLKLSELEDKRKELEMKIENGVVDPKSITCTQKHCYCMCDKNKTATLLITFFIISNISVNI
jgi:hypothetical protein